MKRLEDDDRSRAGHADADRIKSRSPAPFPVPAAETPAAANRAATEQKILVLRERLQSALERGKAEKAAELFAFTGASPTPAPGTATCFGSP